jgi:hypothetical protein
VHAASEAELEAGNGDESRRERGDTDDVVVRVEGDHPSEPHDHEQETGHDARESTRITPYASRGVGEELGGHLGEGVADIGDRRVADERGDARASRLERRDRRTDPPAVVADDDHDLVRETGVVRRGHV